MNTDPLSDAPLLILVVPCLNEEEVLPSTHALLNDELETLMEENLISRSSHILYVDDGSTDNTWNIIMSLGERGRGISLSRNYGHQEALLAGMEQAVPAADIIITIDADLQDDVKAVRKMILKFREGADIVYGIRLQRSSDSWFKRTSARCFYSVMKKLGAQTVANHADFRLMSRRAVEDLMQYGERNLFLRGLIPMIGYRQANVEYERQPRPAGTTKYPLSRMMDFAAEGITSFSVRPVRMLFWIGVLFLIVTTCIFGYALIRYFSGHTIEGWTSLIISLWLCTGMILIGLGIIGEYVGKIYIEVKKRPRHKVARRWPEEKF